MIEKTVTIPASEYASLKTSQDEFKAFRENMMDVLAFDSAMQSGEESIPASVVKRLIAGENPLTVYREHRGLSKSALAEASGVNRIQIGDIEDRGKQGSIRTIGSLARAMDINIGDLAEWMQNDG